MTTEKANSDENSIFVGGKPFMNYIIGVETQFRVNKAKEVTIKSRGKFISKAVDVAEVARRKYLADEKIKIKDIKIGSETFENKEGREVNVSIMEIILSK